MSKSLLPGTYTALITAFHADGSIAWSALEKLLEQQIEANITGIVVCGTTGESATLSKDERQKLVAFVVKKVNHRCLVIAGTGMQSTYETLQQQSMAEDCGVDATLVVTPFYNKPGQQGLLQHYLALADKAQVDLLVYNVPSRTACDIKPATFIELLDHPKIAGIKDATGDLDRITVILASQKPVLLLSGDDVTTLPFILMGGHGTISVLSHLWPEKTVAMVQKALQGELQQARLLHQFLHPWMHALFIEANPIALKCALSLQKKISNHLRLPLTAAQPSTEKTLASLLARTYGS